MSTTDDKTLRKRVVRLADLAGEAGALEGFRFLECELHGPVLLYPAGSTRLRNNHFPAGTDVEGLLWEIVPRRKVIYGAILVRDCVIDSCSLHNVGFAGNKAFIEALRKDLLGTRPEGTA